MLLDPETKYDFHRIYAHHEFYSSTDKADRIEADLYQDAQLCDASPTARYKALTYKRVRNGYAFFFAETEGVSVIYAVYHQREDWQNLIEDRYSRFDDTRD